jgi:DNA-binding CsgD family transcriptional regulator
MLARVQGLSEPAQRVLRVAAVAGRRVPDRLLAGVAGQPEADLEQGLHEAVGAGVLTTDATTGSYAFRHALLQEAVYGDLLPGEQVRLHAAYADLLAADPDGAAAELAHHCLASHDLAGALAASVRAASEAEAVLAPTEALRHLHGALALWELRALYCLAEVSSQLGDLASACAAFDEGAELAERTGLGWSGMGIFLRRGQLKARYRTGDWDECERLLAAVPDLTTLAVADVVVQGLGVLVARARPAASLWLRRLAGLGGADPALDLEGARSAIRRGLAAADAVEIFDQALEGAWVAMNGLSVEADRAEQARTAGDIAALADATAAGRALLERVRADAKQAHGTHLAHDVHVRGRHAKAEAEWTRLQGRSDPARWQAAVQAFSYGHVYAVARCQWRLAEALAGAGDREQATAAARAAHATATRLGAAPLQSALLALARRGRLDLGVDLPAQRALAGLTPRELEVLGLLVEGRSNRQIAEQLFISGKTASVHVTNLLAKLGVHSRLPVPNAPGLAVAAPLRLRAWPQGPSGGGEWRTTVASVLPPVPAPIPYFPWSTASLCGGISIDGG